MQIPFHWPEPKRDKFIHIRLKDIDTLWSGKFKIISTSDKDEFEKNFCVKIYPNTSAPTVPYTFINVSIKLVDNVTYVVFRPGEDNVIAQYVIENLTQETLLLQQKVFTCVHSLHSIRLTLNSPYHNRVLRQLSY